jgi:hypothetical protein
MDCVDMYVQNITRKQYPTNNIPMKEFSICRDSKTKIPDKLSWEEFGDIMKREGVGEAMIYFIDDKYNRKKIIQKAIFALLVEKDQQKTWSEYNIIDHENGDRIMPCLVLLDADPQYVLTRSIIHYPNTFIIQCNFRQWGEFRVNKVEIIQYDHTNFSMN